MYNYDGHGIEIGWILGGVIVLVMIYLACKID